MPAFGARLGGDPVSRLRTDPLFYLALAAAAGIFLADRFPFAHAYAAGAVLVAGASWLGRRRPAGVWLLAPLTALSFAAAHGWHLGAFRAFPAFTEIASQPAGVHVTGRGRVVEEPRAVGFRSEQAAMRLQEITIGGTSYRLRHGVLLRAPADRLQYGDVVAFDGRLHLPESPRNPGEFDYRTHLQRHGWNGIVEVGEGDFLRRIESSPHPLRALAIRARERLSAAIVADLENEPDVCAVLNAMVLGQRHEAPAELETPFRLSGSLHLFAVSGLHVGIFGLVAWMLLKPWGLGRAQVTFLLIPLLFFYAFITGWRPSAVRAATMAGVFLAGFCVHRQPRLLNSLGLAALLILAGNTNQFFRLGFLLSFSVLLAIATLTRPLQRPLAAWLQPDPFFPRSLLSEVEQRAYAFRRWLGDLAGVSLAAWLGSLPFMALVFHLVTPVAVLANVVLMPLAFLVLLTAALSMLCSLTIVFGWAGVLFNNANFALVHVLLASAQTFAALPGAHFHVSGRLPLTRPPVEITVLDLPQGGACTHVHLSQGLSFTSGAGARDELLDIGHAESFQRIIQPYLTHAGLDDLDRLWLTHGDVAHVGAAPALLQDRAPAVYRPLWENRSPSMRRVDALLEARGSPSIRLRAPGTLPAGPHARWEILYPPGDDAFAPAAADDRGLVLRLHVCGWRVLFTADAGLATEHSLLGSGQDLAADVLVQGTPGRDFSGSQPFLDAVGPRLLVLDSETGASPSAVDWATAHGRAVLDQRAVGAVIIGIGEGGLTARGFRSSESGSFVTLGRDADGGRE